jgi:hypothetical protein
MSPYWPLSKSRLIQHPLQAALLWKPQQASHVTGLAWLGLARPDLSVDPKSQIPDPPQISITSKNNTNSTETIHKTVHNFYFRTKPWQTSEPGQLAPDNSVRNSAKVRYITQVIVN